MVVEERRDKNLLFARAVQRRVPHLRGVEEASPEIVRLISRRLHSRPTYYTQVRVVGSMVCRQLQLTALWIPSACLKRHATSSR